MPAAVEPSEEADGTKMRVAHFQVFWMEMNGSP